MTDWDDVDDLGDVVMWAPASIAIIAIVVMIFAYFSAKENEKICQTKTCPPGMQVVLDNHTCMCVVEAK